MEASSKLLFAENGKSSKSEEEVIPIDILTDEIIGLLEQPSQYWRIIGNRSFEMLSSLVQESTVNLIISVRCGYSTLGSLITNYTEQQLEINHAEDVQDDDEEDNDEDAGNSDNLSSADDGNEDDDITQKANTGPKPDDEASESDEESDNESSEEELMDDDQMMQIDEQLATVFRTRIEEKRGKSKYSITGVFI